MNKNDEYIPLVRWTLKETSISKLKYLDFLLVVIGTTKFEFDIFETGSSI
jgi:hypothetical protein